MFHSSWGTQVMLHRRRTMASRLWLYETPHSTLVGAVTRLSYPEAPGFPRCQLRQVSPCSPHASLHAHQPSCAANVAPFRYAPLAGLSPAFTRNQVTRAFPLVRRFMVAQRRYPIAPVLAGRLLAASGDVRLGRTGELHPRAPSVAQRA